MAKVTGPGFSLDAAGTLGGAITFQKSMKGHRVGLVPTHKDAFSTGQSIHRVSFNQARSMWKALSAGSKASYNVEAESQQMTGYNLYIKKVLLGQIAAAGWIEDSYEARVAASYDDASLYNQNPPWYFDRTGLAVPAGGINDAGKQYGGGMRFLNVDIPKGATILTAVLTLTAKNANAGTVVRTRICGELAANAGEFVDMANYQARRGTECGGANNNNRTVAQVDWDSLEAWLVDTQYPSPDITAVIQEIINQAAWASGNALVLFWDDYAGRSDLSWVNPAALRSALSYNSSAAKAPKLTITFKYLA